MSTEIINSLKLTIKDYNYWGESESDSPLKISRTKSVIDPLKIDSKLRKKADARIADAANFEVSSKC